MVEYNKVNVKLLDSQLNKLKADVRNEAEVTLRMNIKMFDGDKLPHELLLMTRQRTILRNAFENNMLGDIKLPKTEISKITQSRGFLGALLSKIVGPFLKVTVLLAPLGVTTSASATDAGIQKKEDGSRMTTLKFSNEEMNV